MLPPATRRVVEAYGHRVGRWVPRRQDGPHPIRVDARGDIYVGENGLQKFSRR